MNKIKIKFLCFSIVLTLFYSEISFSNIPTNTPAYAATYTKGVYSEAVTQQNNQINNQADQSIERFKDSVEIIREMYVDQLSDSKIFDKALTGLMVQLDPHSEYLNEDNYKALDIATSGEFIGIGTEVTMEDGAIKVVSPLDNSPAQKAGIQTGDIILKINDTPVQGMGLDQAIKLIRGKEGTGLTLTIYRKGQAQPLVLKLVREKIEVNSVKNKLIDQYYAYIRISSFQENTTQELHIAIDQLLANSKGQLRGVVLDLRNNPGGLLPISIEVADTFLDLNSENKSPEANRIVSTKGRVDTSDFEGVATPGDQINGIPVVTLINQGSASASEIVAAALQDHHRAVIMGERSFGKGSVQTVMPLADGKTGIKITTARFYSPSGRPIQGEGVTPDVEVAALKLDQSNTQANSNSQDALGYREASLTGALAPERPEVAKQLSNSSANSPANQGADQDKNQNQNSDYQLNAAVNLLKGLYVLDSQKVSHASSKPDPKIIADIKTAPGGAVKINKTNP